VLVRKNVCCRGTRCLQRVGRLVLPLCRLLNLYGRYRGESLQSGSKWETASRKRRAAAATGTGSKETAARGAAYGPPHSDVNCLDAGDGIKATVTATQAVAPDEHVSSVDGYVASPLERASEAAEVEALVSTPLQPGRLGPGSGRSLSRCTPPFAGRVETPNASAPFGGPRVSIGRECATGVSRVCRL